MVGDEYGVMTVTSDGFPVLADDDGVWHYIVSVSRGKPVAGLTIAHNRADRSFSEALELEAIDRKKIRSLLLQSNLTDDSAPLLTRAAASPGDYSKRPDFITKGSPKVLVILVEFPDRKFSKDSISIRNLYDSIYNVTYTKPDRVQYMGYSFERAPGSVSDYFSKQSYGDFTPTFDVIGPYKAANGYATYGKNNGGVSGNDSGNARLLVTELCNKLTAAGFDFTEYDSNSDGAVDMMAVIYAGNGENYAGSDPNTIWPHNWQLNRNLGNGISSVNYFLTCELFESSPDIIDGIGVFCHEFSHTLGLPDFYYGTADDTIASAMGFWSIMDYGVYEHAGFYPVGYTAFERFSVDWLDLPEALKGENTLRPINDGYAMRLSTDSDNRFFILENHQRLEWDAKQRTTGLMVTAVSYDSIIWSSNKINRSRSDIHYYIVPADNDRRRNTAGKDLFPLTDRNVDSLTWNSATPLTVDRHKTALNIYDIRTDGVDVRFTLEKYRGETWVDSPKDGDAKGMVYDLSGCLQPFGPDNLPAGIWIVRDCYGRSRKLSVRQK